MSDFEKWKAAAVRKLKEPKGERVDHRHWRNAYIGNLTPEDAAREIDTRWSNANRPKTKRSPSAKEARKIARMKAARE